jgi:hypothetical protein
VTILHISFAKPVKSGFAAENTRGHDIFNIWNHVKKFTKKIEQFYV